MNYLRGIVRKIFAAILIFAFCGQTFSQGFYYLDYLVNKAAYEKNCVNKNRPALHCHGKCVLMKKIRQQEKQDQQAPELKWTAKTEVLSSRSFFAAGLLLPGSRRSSYHVFDAGTPVDRPSFCFHPPDRTHQYPRG